MTKLSGVKYYTRYIDIRSRKKVYSPTYRGRNILLIEFPPTPWSYPTADEAQQHALRHAKKKKQQIKRFNDNEDYRDKVLARYSAGLTARLMELDEQEEGNE